MPVRIVFETGSSHRLKELLPKKGKTLLVSDQGISRLDFFKGIAAEISPCAVFDQVSPNPTVANVDSLCRLLRDTSADSALALGGGSVMDCAKAACALAHSEDTSIRPYHTEGKKFDGPGIPLTVMPTTAGTGSEVTPFAVLDDLEKGVKGPIASDYFYPQLAVIDPELTHSLPKKISAVTGLDALSHAMEGYWSKNHQPLCDLAAKEAARLVFVNLPEVYERPDDSEARINMSYAALLAGMAFQLPKNAMVHACSFPLSSRYHLPHGTACAFTLEYALKLNAPATGGRMEEFARYCGFSSVAEMADAVGTLKRGGGLPCTFAEAGIPKEDIDTLIEESFHPLMNNNPVEITADHLRDMYGGLAG